MLSGLVASPLLNSTKCSSPSLNIFKLSLDDKALTTDTPTPCNPPIPYKSPDQIYPPHATVSLLLPQQKFFLLGEFLLVFLCHCLQQ